MTENERQRFEREKENARRQFNEMYRGKPAGGLEFNRPKAPEPAGRQQALPVPPLFAPQKGQPSPKGKAEPPAKPQPEQGGSPAPKPEPPKPQNKGFDLLKMLNFNKIEMDNDRLLLLMLCLLLANEKADEKLLLALVYIML